MSKRELIVRELDRLPEQDLDDLLRFLISLRESKIDAAIPMLASESALAKDWLTPEEDAAWGPFVRADVVVIIVAATVRRTRAGTGHPV